MAKVSRVPVRGRPVARVVTAPKPVIKAGSLVEEGAGRFDAYARAVTAASLLTDELTELESELFTASKLQLPHGHLSPTQIEMYLRCPMQYYQRYILGKKSPPPVVLPEGTCHHYTLEQNNLHRIKTGKNRSEADLLDIFNEDWKTRQKEVGDWEGDKPGDVVNRARPMIRTYLKTFAPRLHPRNAERTLAVPIGPVVVAAILDTDGPVTAIARALPAKTDRPAVVDYKTVNKARTERDVNDSVQLALLAELHQRVTGEKTFNVGLCSLVKPTGLVRWESVAVTKQKTLWARALTLSVADSISKGNFPLTSPTNWWCQKKFCGFWKDCRGRFCGEKKCCG